MSPDVFEVFIRSDSKREFVRDTWSLLSLIFLEDLLVDNCAMLHVNHHLSQVLSAVAIALRVT